MVQTPLPQAFETFLAWLQPKKLSAASIKAYGLDLRMVAAELATTLDRIDTAGVFTEDLTKGSMIRAFGRYAAPRNSATVIRAHTTWRLFFDYLVISDLAPGNPMAAIPHPKSPQRQPRPLSGWDGDTTVRLLKSVLANDRKAKKPWPERDFAIVATLLAAGLRNAELRSLDLGSFEGFADQQALRVMGKGNKERTVPIEPELDEALGVYIESRKALFPGWKPKGNHPLFVDADPQHQTTGGQRMSSMQLHYMLDKSLSAAGLGNATRKGSMAHAFRHTYGTTLAADGAPVAAIRKLMGHASINTSQGYIDSLARDERDVASRNRVYDVLQNLRPETTDRKALTD